MTRRRAPFFEKALGAVEYAAMEAVGIAFRRPQPLMQGLQQVGRAYLRAAVRDKDLRAKLTPDYLIGCKRILFSNNYLQSLTKPNVEVHASGVERVEGATVIGADGSTAEVDAIILGTGFHILDMPVADLIRGADGRTLAEHWAGSPEAYQGTSVTGFPNAFVVLGPSLGTGHGSAFAVAESQVAMITEAITAARAQGWAKLDVSPQAQAAYVEEGAGRARRHRLQRRVLPQLLHRRQRPQQLLLAVVHRRAGPPDQPLRPGRLRGDGLRVGRGFGMTRYPGGYLDRIEAQ